MLPRPTGRFTFQSPSGRKLDELPPLAPSPPVFSSAAARPLQQRALWPSNKVARAINAQLAFDLGQLGARALRHTRSPAPSTPSDSATPLPMADRGSRVRATGLALTLVGVGAGLGSTSTLGFILSFVGVLAGANLIAAGALMADTPAAPIGPVVLAAASRALLVRCIRRNLALAGIILASSAVTAVVAAGETAPVLCLCAFVLLLLGLSLVRVKVYWGILD